MHKSIILCKVTKKKRDDEIYKGVFISTNAHLKKYKEVNVSTDL